MNDAIAPQAADQAKKQPRSMLPFVLVGTAVAIAISLVTLRAFLAGSYKVPSGSMLPTIAVGEHVLVNKTDKSIARGKVLVFRSPEASHAEFVKRVVGVGGDVVSTRGNQLIVNGKDVPSCVVGAWTYSDETTKHEGDLVVENLEGTKYLTFHERGLPSTMTTGPWTVAPGEAFVMGDNRENSHDSRMWFMGKGGGVPADNVLGTVRPQGAIGLPVGAEALKANLKACVASL